MDELADYSNTQAKVIREVVANDRGFHSSYYIADEPFYGMLNETEDGVLFTSPNCEASLTMSSTEYSLSVTRSDELKCWFFAFSYGEEETRGIIHFNTIYNAKGMTAIAFLNDSEEGDFDSINRNLPYSNILLLRK